MKPLGIYINSLHKVVWNTDGKAIVNEAIACREDPLKFPENIMSSRGVRFPLEKEAEAGST